MRTRERKEKKKKPGKSDFQEFGNQPTSSEMSKKERKWWKKTHSGEPRTYIKGLCKYWKYSRARNPSQTHLYIQTSDKLKEKPQPLSFAVREFGGSVMLWRPESIHGCSSWSPLNCVSAKSTWMSKNHTQNQKEEGAERRGKKTMEMCQNGELIVRRHKLERGRRGQKTVVSEEETEREMYVADMLAVTLCCHLLFDRNSSSPGEFFPSVPPLSKTLQLPLLHAIPLSSPHYWQNPPKINKFTKKQCLETGLLIFSACLLGVICNSAAWELFNKALNVVIVVAKIRTSMAHSHLFSGGWISEDCLEEIILYQCEFLHNLVAVWAFRLLTSRDQTSRDFYVKVIVLWHKMFPVYSLIGTQGQQNQK